MLSRSVIDMRSVDSKVKSSLEANGVKLSNLGGNLRVLRALAGAEDSKELGFFAQHIFVSFELPDNNLNWSRLSTMRTTRDTLIVSGTLDLWRDAMTNFASGTDQEKKVGNRVKSLLAGEGIVL